MTPADDKATEVLREAEQEIARLQDSANRWALKTTLLIGWIKLNCTEEEQAAARRWINGDPT